MAAHHGPSTLRDVLAAAAERLARDPHLAPSAARDAELLLLHVLGLPRSAIYAYPDRILTGTERDAHTAAISRRLALEPVQYITGAQQFFGLALEVGPGVLIPRPETELLVEAALSRLPHNRPLQLVDVGTGSGAIAIAIASSLPLASITAVDLSPSALQIAGRNIQRHGLDRQITLLQSDLLAALSTSETRFDAVLSNPPYVPHGDRETLHPQVRDFEPEQALFAGDDGLAIYRRLIPEAHAALVADGLLAIEIGFGQRDALTALLGGWRNLEFLPDLQGIPRVALARRP